MLDSMTRPQISALLRTATIAVTALLTSGCADMGYLLQSARGHMAVVQAARPVDQWLAEDATPEDLKQRLRLAQELRRYAVETLKLPDNASYTRYATLPRRAVVWNVVAAPAFSLQPKTWCFPVTGCVAYRGYFNEPDAQAQAASLRLQGWEVSVYPVPAYSTLGKTNWLGGDPLLSTFIHFPQGELARIIFHELAHQVLFVKDDTAFNESFATAVERLGSAAWLADPAHAPAQHEYARLDARRQAFRALATHTRKKLQAIYTSTDDGAIHAQRQQAIKADAYAEFRKAYTQLKATWDGYDRYDAWVANANNAAFAALASYDDWVDAFEVLFARQQGDWVAFYSAAQALANQPREERTRQLQQLQRAKP
ncbi:MAG: aminopeptidase [Rhodoferax sp.]|nr:aminopeptidase [Rhodoferax sp.]